MKKVSSLYKNIPLTIQEGVFPGKKIRLSLKGLDQFNLSTYIIARISDRRAKVNQGAFSQTTDNEISFTSNVSTYSKVSKEKHSRLRVNHNSFFHHLLRDGKVHSRTRRFSLSNPRRFLPWNRYFKCWHSSFHRMTKVNLWCLSLPWCRFCPTTHQWRWSTTHQSPPSGPRRTSLPSLTPLTMLLM